jgi:hypothetical protein
MSESGSALLDWVAAHELLPVRGWRLECAGGGVDPRDEYVETFWLPTLGPSCVLVLRRFAWWLEREPAGFDVSLEDLGRSVGLGTGTGRRGPIVRTLGRLASFNLATRNHESYLVRLQVPMLTPRQVERLPRFLVEHHEMVMRA